MRCCAVAPAGAPTAAAAGVRGGRLHLLQHHWPVSAYGLPACATLYVKQYVMRTLCIKITKS